MKAARIFDSILGDAPRITREGASDPSRVRLKDPAAALRATLRDMCRARRGSDAQRLAGQALTEAPRWEDARRWLADACGHRRTPVADAADALLEQAGVAYGLPGMEG